MPPWWTLTLSVLSANPHPVDLCPRNSSLEALVFSYLLVFSRIPCGSHLLFSFALLLRASCACSCWTPSAFTVCLSSECGDRREEEHVQTPHPDSVFPTDVSPENNPLGMTLFQHPSHSWSSVLVLDTAPSSGTAREGFIPVVVQQLLNPSFLQYSYRCSAV